MEVRGPLVRERLVPGGRARCWGSLRILDTRRTRLGVRYVEGAMVMVMISINFNMIL